MTPRGRRRLRLVLRDLSAGAAFASMAISGELPLWVLAAFGVGLVLALADRRALARVAVASGVALLAAAVALYAQVAAGRLDLVVAACAFAALLTVHRLLCPPGPRTDQQVLLTSLLMIAGGAALSGELLFAFALVLFAVFASGSLTLGVLEDAGAQSAPLPLKPVWRRLSLGVTFGLLGAMVFFLFIPRMNWNVAFRRSARGLGGVTGLSDRVRLGDTGGEIKTNPRVVARIRLQPDPGKDRLDAYWVARTFDTWTGREWTGEGARRRRPKMQVTLRAGSTRLVHQRIELLPAYGARVALAKVDPVVIGNARAHRGGVRGHTLMVEYEGKEVRFRDPADAYYYHAYSAPPDEPAPPPPLTQEERQRLLELPRPLDPRIPALASRLAGEKTDPLEVARALERHLRQAYAYSLELPEKAEDPLAHFLFERREGHCEFFATALAVLLRTRGIPARVATGFFGGERTGDVYLLRAGDAHAWTQVFVEGKGFVNLDATPESGREAQAAALIEWAMRGYEALEELWRGSVLEFSLRDQVGLAFSVVKAGKKAPGKLGRPPREAFFAAALVALAVFGALRLRALLARRRPEAEATKLRLRAEALLGEAGLSDPDAEGFEELAARAAHRRPPARPALDALTRRYLEARFGQVPLGPREAKALEDALRSALGRAA